MLALDEKFGVLGFGCRRPSSIYRGYLGEGGACLEKGEEALQRTLWSFGSYLNVACREILNPSRELQELRLAVGPVAVADALNAPFYGDVNVMNHKNIVKGYHT